MLHICHHWRDEVRVGRHKVLASGYHALFSKKLKAGSSLQPTLGIYLDPDWGDFETKYPKLIVEWPDCGVIELPVLVALVETIKDKLEAGAVIDIGCYLAHGRTGTLLSCLLVDLENLAPGMAISELRQRYCSYAVEYPEQVKLVHSFYHWKDPSSSRSPHVGGR